MKKISIITLGCKVNQVESEKIAEALERAGFEVSMGLGESDIYVINTCAVTNEAERKSRNYIAKILKINSQPKIYICGCSSEHNSANFEKNEHVKKIIGTKNKLTLVDEIISGENAAELEPRTGYKSRVSNRTRADLFVQNGCNNFCTYCIIPYLRGREQSFPLSEIAEEVRALEGFAKEIVVTGINLSAYGKDLEGSEGLIEVARLFKGSPARFRFSSLEVGVITEEFLRELSGFDNFCDHFHLSLQSGSNNTLKAMNRHYTKEQYLKSVNLIRSYFPNAGITTDLIVGFPTETEDDFLESLEFIKSVKFSDMHIFPYSKREGTVAAGFKVVAKNVAGRVKLMAEAASRMKEEFITKNLGTKHEVIIENEKNGFYLAHTKNYILCYISSAVPLAANTSMTVELTEVFEDGAKAKIV